MAAPEEPRRIRSHDEFARALKASQHTSDELDSLQAVLEQDEALVGEQLTPLSAAGPLAFLLAAALHVVVFLVLFSPATFALLETFGSTAGSNATSSGLDVPLAGGFVLSLDRPRLVFTVFAALSIETVFWTAQALCYALMTRPAAYDAWRIRGKDHAKYPSADLLRKCKEDIVLGHAVRPIFLWLAYPLWRGAGMAVSASACPPAATALAHVAFAAAVDDTLFYWSHRLFHENRWLYRTVHKQHHEFGHSVGLAVEYAHLAEDLFSNSLSTLAGPIMLGSHASVVVGYTCMKLWQSIDAHCGMSLPFPLTPWNVLPGMDCARAHDYHHSHNNGNYGGFFMFWDRVCGTDVKYRSRQSPVKKDN